MPNLQDTMAAIAAKKKFPKGARPDTYKPSVDADHDRPTNPPIDKPNRAAVRSSSDHVEPTDLTASSRPPLPVQIEPVQTQPVQKEPVQNEPEQSEPVHSAPVQLEPVHSEPVQAAPVHSEPVQDEP